MSKVGGARAGAGRKKGTPNQRTVELVAGAMSAGKTPIEFMLELMRDEQQDMKTRTWAAEKAAPFLHPRPAPIARPIVIDLPPIERADDIPRAISTVMEAVARGEIAPAEAQSVVAIMEAHRKAIETGEILKRLERLEGAK